MDDSLKEKLGCFYDTAKSYIENSSSEKCINISNMIINFIEMICQKVRNDEQLTEEDYRQIDIVEKEIRILEIRSYFESLPIDDIDTDGIDPVIEFMNFVFYKLLDENYKKMPDRFSRITEELQQLMSQLPTNLYIKSKFSKNYDVPKMFLVGFNTLKKIGFNNLKKLLSEVLEYLQFAKTLNSNMSLEDYYNTDKRLISIYDEFQINLQQQKKLED